MGPLLSHLTDCTPLKRDGARQKAADCLRSGGLVLEGLEVRRSDVARHLPGLEAGRAHVEALGGAVDESTHTLDVGVPPAVGPHVGVRDALAEDGALAANVAHSSHGLTPDLQCFNAQADARRQVLPPRRGALGNPNTIADLRAGPQAALACVPAHAALLDTRGLSVRQTGSVLYLTMQGVCAPGGCGGNGLTSAPVARMLHRFSGALSKVPVRAPRSGGRNVSRQVL